MKLSVPTCPTCKQPACGIIERVNVMAWISRRAQNGEYEYVGESEVDWDTQQASFDANDMAAVRCPAGHFWDTEVEDT